MARITATENGDRQRLLGTLARGFGARGERHGCEVEWNLSRERILFARHEPINVWRKREGLEICLSLSLSRTTTVCFDPCKGLKSLRENRCEQKKI